MRGLGHGTFCAWPLKRCSRCKAEKPYGDFSANASNSLDGKQRECKFCAEQSRVAWRAAHPERAKELNYTQGDKERARQRDYGLTPAAYIAMLATQDFRCAVCKATYAGIYNGKLIDFPVDHDHVTGKVRGGVCTCCNTAIGLLKDSPTVVRALADYLEKHS